MATLYFNTKVFSIGDICSAVSPGLLQYKDYTFDFSGLGVSQIISCAAAVSGITMESSSGVSVANMYTRIIAYGVNKVEAVNSTSVCVNAFMQWAGDDANGTSDLGIYLSEGGFPALTVQIYAYAE
jgi:hypothetical protein